MRVMRYPKYKESGITEVPFVPSHWDLRRCRYLFREVDKRSDDGKETHLSMSQMYGLIDSSRIEKWRMKSASYAGGKLCEEGDLVLNRLKAHLGVFAYANQAGVVSPDYTVLRQVTDDRPRYFELLFKSPPFITEFTKATKGIVKGFWRLYTDDFYSIRAFVPPRDEQQFILNFVDAITAKTSQFIRNKRRLIELLKEQKQNIINQAVTRGLDPDVKLKPSGVEWIGDIPVHWELRRLKYLCRNVNRQTSEKMSDEVYIALEHVEAWTGRISLPSEDVPFDSQVKRFEAGDVLFGKLRPYLAKVTKPLVSGVCVGEFLVLRPSLESVSGEYLEQKLRSRDVIDVINSSTFGAKMPRADWAFIGNLKIAYPPKSEQQEILRHIHEQSVQIDETITRAEREIELIREYRTRLISDVVTGQVDVRGIELPEVTEEELQALGDAPEETEELIDDEAAAELAQ